MGSKHLFQAKLKWESLLQAQEGTASRYTKNHVVSFDGKMPLEVSAAKAFKGDPSKYNPEDLLLASIVSCHMMSYLYVCSKNNIEVLSYSDNAEATLEVLDNGGGRFVEVRLYPRVVLRDESAFAKALELHKEAKELCFIANSCNFPILHFPTAVL